jgi:hypothetical protein
MLVPKDRLAELIQSAGLSLHVVDANGNDMPCVSSTASENPAAGKNTLTYIFSGQPNAKQMIWDVPIDARLVDIPVNFKDLNLDLPL